MRPDQTTDWWKGTALFLGGIVLALCGVWTTYVRNAVTRDEMQAYMDRQLVYVDRELSDVKKGVDRLNEKMDAVLESQKNKREVGR